MKVPSVFSTRDELLYFAKFGTEAVSLAVTLHQNTELVISQITEVAITAMSFNTR
jgi:hypothetical protein